MTPTHQLRIAIITAVAVLATALLMPLVPAPLPVYAQQAATPTMAVPTPAYPITAPGPIPASVTVIRKTDPDHFTAGQSVNVTLALHGENAPGCFGIPGKPVDAIIVFDISTSAGMGPGSNWEKTVGITKALFANLQQPVYQDASTLAGSSQVGIVSSKTGTRGPEPLLLQTLTSDYGLLATQMDGLSPSGDTDMAAGLDLAATELAKYKSLARSQAIVLMLHDNVALSQGTKDALSRLSQQGFSIYIVVNSLNIPAEQQIASATTSQLAVKKTYIDPAPAELRELFLLATEGNTNLVAGSLRLSEAIKPANQAGFSNVSGGGSVIGDQVVWEIPGIKNGEDINVGYELRILSTGNGNIDFSNEVRFLDCNGFPQTINPNIPSVQIQPPVAETATKSAGIVSNVTPTTTPVPLPAVIPVTNTKMSNLGIPFLMLLPWLPDWLWLLLLVLLLLLLLFLLYWLFFRNKKTASEKKIAPGERAAEPIKIGNRPSTRGETGTTILADIKIEAVSDQKGAQLKRYTSWTPNRIGIKDAIANGQRAQVDIYLKDELPGRPPIELCRIVAKVVLNKKMDTLTGKMDVKNSASVALSSYDPQEDRGFLELMMEELVIQARELNIKELEIEKVPDNLWPRLQRVGFEKNKNSHAVMKIL